MGAMLAVIQSIKGFSQWTMPSSDRCRRELVGALTASRPMFQVDSSGSNLTEKAQQQHWDEQAPASVSASDSSTPALSRTAPYA